MKNITTRGMQFIEFTLRNVKSYRNAYFIIVAKILNKVLKIPFKDISFDMIINGVRSTIIVNDPDQYTHLYKLIYNESFKISKKIPDNPLIIDGGANIGMSSIYYLLKFPEAKILAFDPTSENVSKYKHNLSSFMNAKIEQKALWDKSETIDFHFSKCSRYHSLFAREGNSITEKVKAVRLDEWLDENNIQKIDILKLNVEGAELKVIRGLGKRIRDVNVIVGELHPEFVEPDDLIKELKKNNFSVVRLEQNGQTVSVFEAHNNSYQA